MSISIRLNGERRAVPVDTCVRDLVTMTAGAGAVTGVAVAVDDRVVPRSDWDRPVTEGAHVEILTAVQGG